MQDIEEQAFDNYQKNLEYISREHKDLAKTLSIFEQALASGDYIPEFDLEYIDGYFDIKEVSSGNFLYNENSLEVSKILTKRVNYSKDSQLFEGFPILNLSDDTLSNLGENLQIIEGISPQMKYYVEHVDITASMKQIAKYIFIGTGLGFHISQIAKKISAQHYFIIEDNLEIFKLSLFTTKYYEIAQTATLYFSVADSENMFYKTMHGFLESDFFDNRYLKYTHFLTHSNNKIKHIQNVLTTQPFIFFPYRAELYKFLKPLELLNSGYNTLNLTTNINSTLFIDKPSIVIAAGPSLQTHIEWLKENHQRFVIIAVSAVLNTLYKHNIKPDILTHLDGSIETMDHYDDVKDTDFLEQTLMFFGPNIKPELRAMFDKKQMFFYEEGTNYYKDFNSVSTPCIGSFSTLLSLILNTKETYLLGLDLALNQETGETHSSEHTYSKKIDMSQKDKVKDTMSFTNNFFPVEGNFRQTVYTNPLLHASVYSLNNHIPAIKQKKQVLYNLNDGAKIQLTIPTKVIDIQMEEYKIINKQTLFTEAQKILLKNSVQDLTEEDANSLKKRIVQTDSIYKLIKEYQNSVSHTNTDKYLYDLLGLTSSILHKQDRESVNLSYIFLEYFKYSLSMTMDFFNTKGLKNEKRHIKKLDKMMQKEMLRICEIYKEEVQNFIEEKL